MGLFILDFVKNAIKPKVHEPRLNNFADINFQKMAGEACIEYIYGKYKTSIPANEIYKVDSKNNTHEDIEFVNSYMSNKVSGDSFYQSISEALKTIKLPENIYKPLPEESATFVTQVYNVKTMLGLINQYKKTLDKNDLEGLEGKIAQKQRHADNIYHASKYSYPASPEGAGDGRGAA